MKKKATKKLQRAWAMYDWGNSAYNLVITSTIFPTYYNAVTTQRENGVIVNDTVHFLGFAFKNTTLSEYAIAFAYLIVVLLSPILSSIADLRGNKKLFMQLFTYVGALACCGLFFFEADTVTLGLFFFVLAAIGYCGSLVFYNSYLPEIADADEQDKVSAKGFALGYVGSVLLQIVCFTFFFFPEWYGMTKENSGLSARISFLLVGLWWIGWAQIPFRILPNGKPRLEKTNKNLITNGFHELQKVAKRIGQMPVLKLYLGAFFMYSMGVQTIMLAAANFGAKELNLPTDQLIITILIIQVVAIAGAFLMAQLSRRFGNFNVLLLTIFIWMGACIFAYFTTNNVEFFALAGVVGLIMGGIQSLSRSTYSKLIPSSMQQIGFASQENDVNENLRQDNTSFFSFYDVTEKMAIVIGMFSFGFIEQLTGNMRMSIIALIGFFAAGAIFLFIARRKQKLSTLPG